MSGRKIKNFSIHWRYIETHFQIYGVFKNETIRFGGAAKNLENRTQPNMLSPWARYIQIQMCTEAMCHASIPFWIIFYQTLVSPLMTELHFLI